MKKILSYLTALLCCSLAMSAQTTVGGLVSFDKTVHDYGDIMLSDGPVSCTFQVKNVSQKDVVIYSVVSSCGCTDVKWTREAIKPGMCGSITAKYSNDEGAYPFDKTLTVYVSDIKRPVILHIRGVVHDRKKPLAELFPEHFGPLGLRTAEIKAGNLLQGESKSGEFTVANLSDKTVTISFKDVSGGLFLKPGSVAIQPSGQIPVSFTIKADRNRWGKNWYEAGMYAGGKKVGMVRLWAITKENFSSMDKQQRAQAAAIMFDESTSTFNPVKPGARFEASFSYENSGKSDLLIYKIETDRPDVVTLPPAPAPLKPGARTTISCKVDTAGQQAGEQLYMVTLYTNAPLRPVVNLFITGFLK